MFVNALNLKNVSNLANVLMRDMLVTKSLFSTSFDRKSQPLCLSVFLAIIISLLTLVSAQGQNSDEYNSSLVPGTATFDTTPSPADIQQSLAPTLETPTAPAPITPITPITPSLPVAPVIPVPPQIALPSPAQPGINQEPLAWRAKASAMLSEYPFNEKTGLVWVLPIAYDKGRNLLKLAINQAGLEIVAEYPDAGQYLICSPPVEMKTNQTIIVSQPAGQSKTLFKLRIYSGSRSPDNKKINSLPSTMKGLLENRGLWQ
jgi:hypothetical protein